MKSHLLEFINSNPDWKQQLQQSPYNITIREDNGFVLFMYGIGSDFSIPLVLECRGIIIREETKDIVCFPFTKFFNVQEQYAAKVDWDSAVVQEKIDGSIIKLWYDFKNDGWIVSTNGTIYAEDAELMTPNTDIKNFLDLFTYAENLNNINPLLMDTNKTYIFELVSPYNKIVVPYTEIKLYHIGTRNNETLEECDDWIGVQQPHRYSFTSLEECLESCEKMPFDEEGYVVVDKNFNRVKIKSPAYVAAHHLRGNGIVTKNSVLDVIRLNGEDDFLSIYPEYKKDFDSIFDKLGNFIIRVEDDWVNFLNRFPYYKNVHRKELAEYIKNLKYPSVVFLLLDNKINLDNLFDWIMGLPNDKILRLIEVPNTEKEE